MGKGGVNSDSQALDLNGGAEEGEWRKEQVRRGEDESKVLFCTQLHVLCLLDIYGEFGWAVWSTEKGSGLKMAISSYLGLK